MKRLCLLFLLIFAFICIEAQSINLRKDWHFGKHASIEFDDNNEPNFSAKNPYDYNSKLGAAYFKNGTLAFLTGGQAVYDSDLKLVTNLIGIFSSDHVQVVNHSQNDSLFYILTLSSGKIFSSIYNAYSKNVIQNPKAFHSNGVKSFVVIKHCFASGYWIITPTTKQEWQSYYLNGGEIQKGEVSSIPFGNVSSIGKIVSNYKGDKIAVSTYSDTGFVTLYDFNSKCGQVSNGSKLPLEFTQIPWDYPLGIDFSPNDEFLFVCYSYQESQLVQYKVSDISDNILIAKRDQNFDDIAMGSDGKAYLNRHVSSIPSRKIDVIEFPNKYGLACNYQEEVFQLANGTNGGFSLPPFVNASTKSYCEGEEANFSEGYSGMPCIGNKLEFYVNYADQSFASNKWIIKYDTNADVISGKTIEIILDKVGVLEVFLVKQFCMFYDTIKYKITINEVPDINLSKDTIICYGSVIQLESKGNAESLLWSTGDTSRTITAVKGNYYITAINGLCATMDSVRVIEFEPLSILLGEAYFLCRKEQELVKLDAGKGFQNYLWYPTKDTTQWIIVNDIGDYFVVVSDFNGCTGDKSTRVKERCDLTYYIPNAFSPNGDNLNNVFRIVGDGIKAIEMQIYNRWGEQVYNGTDLDGWDGSGVQSGIYIYLLKIEGYKNKKRIIYYDSGSVTLIK